MTLENDLIFPFLLLLLFFNPGLLFQGLQQTPNAAEIATGILRPLLFSLAILCDWQPKAFI